MINITRREMIALLKHYRAERESIESMLVELSKDLDAVYSPSATSLSNVVVQHQFSPSKQIDALLRKCDAANAIKRETLQNMKDKTYQLDRIMFVLSKLPGDLRDVLLAIELNDETLDDYADRIKVSRKTVVNRKARALDMLYARLTRRNIDGWHADT